jgi:hypothetical protein
MSAKNEIKDRSYVVHAARRCRECNEEALGRCPDCHHSFCQDHFPKHQHLPCAQRQMKMEQSQLCYVCGRQVRPQQWSLSRTFHMVDQFVCLGCGWYVCDDLHTQRKTEDVVITREGVRGHRYQYINRYCDLCAPFYQVGGIKGLARIVVIVGTVVATAFFYLHH